MSEFHASDETTHQPTEAGVLSNDQPPVSEFHASETRHQLTDEAGAPSVHQPPVPLAGEAGPINRKKVPPPGWRVEPIKRENGKFKGRYYKLYYEPGTNKCFRSLKMAWARHDKTETMVQPGQDISSPEIGHSQVGLTGLKAEATSAVENERDVLETEDADEDMKKNNGENNQEKKGNELYEVEVVWDFNL